MTQSASTTHDARMLYTLMALAATLLVFPATTRAQDAKKIYDLSEVDAMPKLTSPAYMQRLMADAYPASLRKAGVGGSVQVEFVVDEKGKVDVGTIDAISPVAGLIDVAKAVAPKLEFTPAKVKGTAVKSHVVLPLVFKP